MVITPHDESWRPVRLKDSGSVDYLNRLLDEGWYLVELGVHGLPALAFAVPLEPVDLKPGEPRWTFKPREAREEIMMVVLHRGTIPSLQKAVITCRNSQGYVDLSQVVRERGWRRILSVQCESGDLVTFMQRT